MKKNLVRYIQCFLNEGFDLFEEFIELPLDFFDKMKNPFLNQKQREKLYKKLEPYKNINKKQKINNENKKEILNNENKKEILNDENKKELNIKIKSEIGCGTNNEIIEKIESDIGQTRMMLKRTNDYYIKKFK